MQYRTWIALSALLTVWTPPSTSARAATCASSPELLEQWIQHTYHESREAWGVNRHSLFRLYMTSRGESWSVTAETRGGSCIVAGGLRWRPATVEPQPIIAIPKPGDSIWSLMKTRLYTAGLNEPQKLLSSDVLDDVSREIPREVLIESGVRSGDPDLIYAGEPINLETLFPKEMRLRALKYALDAIPRTYTFLNYPSKRCFPRAYVTAKLWATYAEVIQWTGDVLDGRLQFELFTQLEPGGSFTMLTRDLVQEVSCYLYSGEGWHQKSRRPADVPMI